MFCYSFYSLWPPDDYIEQLYISLLYMYISLFLFFFTSKHLVSDFAKWPHQRYITLWSLSPFTLSAQILRPSRDKSTDMRILYFSPVKMGACYRTPKQAVVFKGSNGVWSSGRHFLEDWATRFGQLGDTSQVNWTKRIWTMIPLGLKRRHCWEEVDHGVEWVLSLLKICRRVTLCFEPSDKCFI